MSHERGVKTKCPRPQALASHFAASREVSSFTWLPTETARKTFASLAGNYLNEPISEVLQTQSWISFSVTISLFFQDSHSFGSLTLIVSFYWSLWVCVGNGSVGFGVSGKHTLGGGVQAVTQHPPFHLTTLPRSLWPSNWTAWHLFSYLLDQRAICSSHFCLRPENF